MKTLAFATLLLTITSSTAFAHPGRTASDGCHFCRTNCSDWGVPKGQRHCHGTYNKEHKPALLVEAAYKGNTLEHHSINASHNEHGHTHDTTERKAEVTY